MSPCLCWKSGPDFGILKEFVRLFAFFLKPVAPRGRTGATSSQTQQEFVSQLRSAQHCSARGQPFVCLPSVLTKIHFIQNYMSTVVDLLSSNGWMCNQMPEYSLKITHSKSLGTLVMNSREWCVLWWWTRLWKCEVRCSAHRPAHNTLIKGKHCFVFKPEPSNHSWWGGSVLHSFTCLSFCCSHVSTSAM